MKRYAVVIGRFQPAHLGHKALIDAALAEADEVVVVLGSAFRARDPKNPFSWQERRLMVQALVSPENQGRLHFVPVRDYYDDAKWVHAVTEQVGALAGRAPVSLVGHFKDQSSYYLRKFPQWGLVEVARTAEIDATALRRVLFEAQTFEAAVQVLGLYMPKAAVALLSALTKLPYFEVLVAEHRALCAYRQKWPGIHTTLDAVVKASGHVLLVRRGGDVGNGLWAVPGGFLEPGETLYDGALRELAEETGLTMLPSTMELAFKGVRVFSHPGRSLRGRIITHAHFFDLGELRELPAVKAASDAKLAEWVPIEQLASMENMFFEDHASILAAFLGIEYAEKDATVIEG